MKKCKIIFATICAVVLMFTSITSIMQTSVEAQENATVEDIILTGAVFDYGNVDSYLYNYSHLKNATSDYKYMFITYVGDISELRIEPDYKTEYEADHEGENNLYWMNQSHAMHFALVGDSPVLSSEETTTLVIDIEATGINFDEWDGMHMHYGPGTLNITYARLSVSSELKDIPEPRYFKDKAPVEDYAYSFAVVGDTQVVVESDLKWGVNDLSKIYDWILDNKITKNIQYVFGLGDVINNLGDTNNCRAEWAYAKQQISRLDGNIPYSVVRGNHDISGIYFNKEDNTDYFSQYLGTDAYKDQFVNGGFYGEGNILNSWRTFSVGDIDYLMITLDNAPSDEVLAWANDVVKSHPNHNVIITTHAYLDKDGNRYASNQATFGGYNSGEDIWEKFVSKHKNIVLVMCGHVSEEKIIVSQDKGINGNTVTSMLINPQGIDGTEGSTGMVAMLYFSKDGKKVQVEYYSTVRESFFLKDNQFSLELPVVEKKVDSTIDKPSTENPTTVEPTTKPKITAPAKTKVLLATKKVKSKKVKLSIKKIKDAKGYQIQFSVTKKFKKIILTKTVKKANVTISNKKFKKAKKLYVRVKAYKINGKKKVFAKKWSIVKKVKIK